MRRFAPLLALAGAACATSSVNEPSLGRRPAEAIDPRVPIASDPVAGPADASLGARLGALVAEGKAGAAAFAADEREARRLADGAGPAQSESWILAQQALSGLEASRARTMRAMADIDDIAADRIQAAGGISLSDQAAIEAATGELRGSFERQASVLADLAARLAR